MEEGDLKTPTNTDHKFRRQYHNQHDPNFAEPPLPVEPLDPRGYDFRGRRYVQMEHCPCASQESQEAT